MKNIQNDKELDKWEKSLLEQLNILKECQVKNKIKSCLKCQMVIGCEIRKEYVNTVYKSMNKGQGGGFEF